MDTRRLDSMAILNGGILNRPGPRTDIPEGRLPVDAREGTREDARCALDSGRLLDVPEYYGCVHAWKDDAGYHGRLLQYRKLTEAPDFATAEECLTWFYDTVDNVTG
jgi:hypothetical protein